MRSSATAANRSGRYLDLQSAEVGWQSSQIQLLSSRLGLLKLLYDLEAKFQSKEQRGMLFLRQGKNLRSLYDLPDNLFQPNFSR
jgi:hypothetical protein